MTVADHRDFAVARRAMIDSQLRPQGITDPQVLAAFASLERERFVPEGAMASAYADRSIPLGGGRAMMAPAALARMVEELVPVAGERALVVGSGTGFAANLLATLGCEVVALESDRALAARSGGVETHVGRLEDGLADRAPYDLILIDGAVEELPQALVDQLADGGRLAAGIVENGVARIAVGRRLAGHFGLDTIADASIPRLPGFARAQAFTF